MSASAELGYPASSMRYKPRVLKASIKPLEEGISRAYTRGELVQKLGVSSAFLSELVRRGFLRTEDFFGLDSFNIESNSIERTREMFLHSRERLRECNRSEEEVFTAAFSIAVPFLKNKWDMFERVANYAATHENADILPLKDISSAIVELFGEHAEDVFASLLEMKVPQRENNFIGKLSHSVAARAAIIKRNQEIAKGLSESVRRQAQPNAVDFLEDVRSDVFGRGK